MSVLDLFLVAKSFATCVRESSAILLSRHGMPGKAAQPAALHARVNRAQMLPLRQTFVRISPQGQLKAGTMSIVAGGFLPHEDIR